MRRFKCPVCGFIYDEAKGLPEQDIAPGTRWEDLPDSFVCPECRTAKARFVEIIEMVTPAAAPTASEAAPAAAAAPTAPTAPAAQETLRELSVGEIAALCSNLAKGCEKQLLLDEKAAFTKLADYYTARIPRPAGASLSDAAAILNDDIARKLPAAKATAQAAADRGALRSLTWGEKVSTVGQALLQRYASEGDAMLANTKIWVCDISGFTFVGDTPPALCPVCKVGSFKINAVERS
ncbi:MAG: rubredoxin [Actinomycetia bacterium]|nr:rubredoxin [Actinomycetes bacterium]